MFGREELAATDRRIIHVRKGRCRDISYGFLTSIENGWSADWKWGRRALYAVLASVVFACISLIMPAFIVQEANSLSDYSNSLVDQMTSAIIPPAYQGPDGYDFSLVPGVQLNSPVIDFSGPAGSIGMSVSRAFTALTVLAVALSVLFLLAFIVQIKKALILTTPMDRHVFYYGRGQEKAVTELIKILRVRSRAKNISAGTL